MPSTPLPPIENELHLPHPRGTVDRGMVLNTYTFELRVGNNSPTIVSQLLVVDQPLLFQIRQYQALVQEGNYPIMFQLTRSIRSDFAEEIGLTWVDVAKIDNHDIRKVWQRHCEEQARVIQKLQEQREWARDPHRKIERL